MQEVRIKGKRVKRFVAEWKDIKAVVERHLREYKSFYAQLAEL